jgi:hypothetical protein
MTVAAVESAPVVQESVGAQATTGSDPAAPQAEIETMVSELGLDPAQFAGVTDLAAARVKAQTIIDMNMQQGRTVLQQIQQPPEPQGYHGAPVALTPAYAWAAAVQSGLPEPSIEARIKQASFYYKSQRPGATTAPAQTVAGSAGMNVSSPQAQGGVQMGILETSYLWSFDRPCPQSAKSQTLLRLPCRPSTVTSGMPLASRSFTPTTNASSSSCRARGAARYVVSD